VRCLTRLSGLTSHFFSVCLLVAAAAAPAFAQQRLFVRMASEVVELDPRPASLGTVIRRFAMPGIESGQSNRVVPFWGGQFLAGVRHGNGAIVLLNTRSGAVHEFKFPALFAEEVVGTDGFARLLVRGRGGNIVLVAAAQSGSTHFLDLGRFEPYPRVAYASASDVLFVASPTIGNNEPQNFAVDVIHASTGRILETLDVSPVAPIFLTPNAAGTRLFVSDGLRTLAFDVISGTLLASTTESSAGSGTTVDEQRNRLMMILSPRGAGEPLSVAAFSADSLESIYKIGVPELPVPETRPDRYATLTHETDFSGLSATIFVLQAVQVHRQPFAPTCHESQLIALDAHTGDVRQTVRTTGALGAGACNADLIRITEPAPPAVGPAEVTGRQVTLKWSAPFGATHYEVEAGGAPGLANLARIVVGEPQLVVNDVPSGVYYVRVHAINTVGKSSASREIQIVVP
jgi:hypothetical protein